MQSIVFISSLYTWKSGQKISTERKKRKKHQSKHQQSVIYILFSLSISYYQILIYLNCCKDWKSWKAFLLFKQYINVYEVWLTEKQDILQGRWGRKIENNNFDGNSGLIHQSYRTQRLIDNPNWSHWQLIDRKYLFSCVSSS